MRGIAIDKWYLDALLDDGGVLVVTFVRLRWLGIPVAWIAASLRAGDAERRGSSFAGRLRQAGEGVHLGGARVEAGRVAWTTPGLSGDLELRPRYPAATLCDPVFADGRQLLRWRVEVPDADVGGRLSWPGGGCAVRGRAYVDRVWGHAVPWRFPVRRLRWGHAVARDRCAVWFEAETSARVLHAGWEDGRVNAGEVAVSSLEDGRVLLDENPGDRLAGQARVLRRACRRLTGGAHQTRWTAAARLGGEEARAVYEYVQWR